MMPSFFKYICVTAWVLMITACASTPESEPIMEEVVEVVILDPEPEPAPEPEPEPLFIGPVPGSVEDFRVNVGERIYFELDQYALDDMDRAILQRQAAWLRNNPQVKIRIAGNCDERGTREYNLALGDRRANAAASYLISLGISQSRVSTISYGKERPIDPRASEEAWRINRNAHTQVMAGAVG